MPALHNKGALIVLILGFSTAIANASDADGDGIVDVLDNCSAVANSDQRDSDGDNFGNLCDADFDNDNIVNFADLNLLAEVFFQQGNIDEDMNGDGIVNFTDLNLLADYFFSVPGPAGALVNGIQPVEVFTDVDLAAPVSMKQAPGDSDHWYVAERSGRIVRFENIARAAETEVVLDISSLVDTFFEGGFLGFAFDPAFADNGRVFVSYTVTGSSSSSNPLDSRISMFTLDSQNMNVFDEDSELVIIQVDQPYGNHNGGDISFGADGFLYWSLGDGGSGGDPENSGQDQTTLLGSIVRIDVDISQADIDNEITYRIPETNPFFNSNDCSTGCREIFAYGFRNPWRFSFDSLNGDLYAGDVGQSSREEIDLVTVGGNYGWRCYEGNVVFNQSGCLPIDNYIFPLVDYGRTLGNSITGGYVYRGNDFPGMNGVYFYGDYGSGRIWGLIGGADLGQLVDTTFRIASFGQGHDGEVYALHLFTGAIYKLEPAT
ncbi:MAG: glucose sorbosone dehydrogenase [Gammaproteobacteria bacterium]|nr:glucose sorbosone dehydrogenase [Gammaproteobacteria bacterium]